MARRDKKNFPITFRVDGGQKDYIEELKQQGINLRDVLEYYRANTSNETARLNNREKQLVIEIKELETALNKAKEELAEVRVKLNKAPTEDQMEIAPSIASGTILNNCKIRNDGKADKETLANYMETKEAKDVIKNVMIRFKENDISEFEKKVLKILKLNS